MKIKVLGSAPPWGNRGMATSSYLVEVNNKNILLDCGHGSYLTLQENMSIDHLDAIVITHFHPDHFVDIFAIRNFLYHNKIKKKIQLIVPDKNRILNSLIDALRLPQDYFSSCFILSTLSNYNEFEISNISFTPILTRHSIETYGLRIKSGEKVILYSSDSGFTQWFLDQPANMDLLIIECGNANSDIIDDNHLSPTEIAHIIRTLTPNKVWITHYDAREKKKIVQQLNTHGVKFVFAKPLKEITL